MNGIFGVGLGEMILIVLVLLIIGGPRNVVKWSHEAGRIIASMRRTWSRMVAELDREMDEETRELVKASQELRRGFQDVQNVTDPRRYTNLNQLLQEGSRKQKASPPPESQEQHDEPPARERYSDWVKQADDESHS